jgi:hypothetical protein
LKFSDISSLVGVKSGWEFLAVLISQGRGIHSDIFIVSGAWSWFYFFFSEFGGPWKASRSIPRQNVLHGEQGVSTGLHPWDDTKSFAIPVSISFVFPSTIPSRLLMVCPPYQFSVCSTFYDSKPTVGSPT